MTILITGVAGFIGFHVARRLLARGERVAGFDALTDYYDPALKAARLGLLEQMPGFAFTKGRLEDEPGVRDLVSSTRPEVVIHLAAQAGVRYALEAPQSYVQSNVTGTANLLEALRAMPPKHLLFASTSSVYGGNRDMPFHEDDRTDFPVSLYAATKKAGEAMCHSYAHLFGIPTTALRFFTVYGPWGRPDMALFKFVRSILADEPIDIYGHGAMRRDFTYIDDLADTLISVIDHPPSAGAASSRDSLSPVAPFRTLNIGGGQPVALMDFVAAIEASLGRTARKTFLPMQPGDVVETSASPELLETLLGTRPQTTIGSGVAEFVNWYRGFYGA